MRADLELRGGVRIERLRIVALPALQAPLLGMDVLGKLHWRQSDGVLSIDLKGGGRPMMSQLWLHARAWAAAALLALQPGLAPSRRPSARQPPPAPTAEQWQAAQREARDVGLLWRLSKDGRDSWLFGTLHVGKLAWSAPGPALRQALARSDVLALEIDPTDPQLAGAAAAGHARRTDGRCRHCASACRRRPRPPACRPMRCRACTRCCS